MWIYSLISKIKEAVKEAEEFILSEYREYLIPMREENITVSLKDKINELNKVLLKERNKRKS